MKRLITVGALCAAPAPALAHAFTAGADIYDAFREGIAVPFSDAAILLPLATAGLVAGLWAVEALRRTAPVLIPAILLGMGAAPLVGPAVIPVALALGLILAAIGALMSPAPVWAALPGTAAAAALGGLVALEGHGWGELQPVIYVGIFFGLYAVFALPAGLTQAIRERNQAVWTGIGLRIAASWMGAVLAMLLAFTVAPSAV